MDFLSLNPFMLFLIRVIKKMQNNTLYRYSDAPDKQLKKEFI